MPPARIERRPARRLIASPGPAGNDGDARLDSEPCGQLRDGETVRRRATRADDRDRPVLQGLGGAAHIQDTRRIGQFGYRARVPALPQARGASGSSATEPGYPRSPKRISKRSSRSVKAPPPLQLRTLEDVPRPHVFGFVQIGNGPRDAAQPDNAPSRKPTHP